MISAIAFDASVEFVPGQLVGQLSEDSSTLVHEDSPLDLSRGKASEFLAKIEIENTREVVYA